MYIDRFVAGVLVTLLVELVGIIIYGIYNQRRNKQ